MKLLFSVVVLLSLTACASEEKAEEPVVLQENVEANEFTREEMVEAQLPRLKKRSTQEKLNRPLGASFFEESFMLVNLSPTDEETSSLPLLFAVTEGEVEITQVLPKEGLSPNEIEGTLISENSDFEVDTVVLKVIQQSFSANVLTLVVQSVNATEIPIEFTQVANGIFVDEAGNEYRALSGVLEISI